jgi:peptide/nickel transport system permease protein
MIVLRSFSRNKGAQVGLVIFVLMLLMAAFGPLLTPYDPVAINPSESMKPPSLQHLMGTDRYGRDVFSRVIAGARVSLTVGFLAVVIGSTGGTLIGLSSGTVGGTFDTWTMRFMDLWFAFPPLLLALAVAAVLGPGLVNTMLAVGIATVPSYARLTRASVLSAKQAVYALAAISVGCSSTRLAYRHILPNVVAPVIVLATFAVASSILAAASLSFLGLGAQPPQPEWGADLSAGRNYLRQAWWISTLPGLAITLTVLSINMLGDGLRDALDPRLKLD